TPRCAPTTCWPPSGETRRPTPPPSIWCSWPRRALPSSVPTRRRRSWPTRSRSFADERSARGAAPRPQPRHARTAAERPLRRHHAARARGAGARVGSGAGHARVVLPDEPRGGVHRARPRPGRGRRRRGGEPRRLDALPVVHPRRDRAPGCPLRRGPPLRRRGSPAAPARLSGARPRRGGGVGQGPRRLPGGARRAGGARPVIVDRQERLLGAVADRGLDAMLVTDLVNVRYLTGYVGSNGAAILA